MRGFAAAAIVTAVLLAACSGAGASSAPKGGTGGTLTGPTWVLTQYGSGGAMTNVPSDVYADATFKAAIVNGNSGCNAYTGPYTASGATIKAGPLASTQMACSGPAGDVEKAFLAGLGGAATFTATSDSLTIFNASGSATLVFKAGTQGKLTGTTWHLIAYNNGKQAVVSTEANTDATAVFGTDGTVSGNASCNQFNGPYKTTGDSGIKIGPIAGTMMACTPDAVNNQEQAYLAGLQAATTYSIQGKHLELRDDSGALQAQFESR